MANFKRIVISGGGGMGYATIQEDGVALPQETVINFTGAGVTVTDNPGVATVVNIPGDGSGFNWVNAPSSTTMSPSAGYNASSASLVTLTLPTTAAFGTVIAVSAYGTGGFTIAQNAGQVIHFGNQTTTSGTGGSISSTARYDTISFFCSSANTGFTVTSSVGNLNVI